MHIAALGLQGSERDQRPAVGQLAPRRLSPCRRLQQLLHHGYEGLKHPLPSLVFWVYAVCGAFGQAGQRG